ncbi:hypothetical protein D3C76_1622010 [compost metagenome]
MKLFDFRQLFQLLQKALERLPALLRQLGYPFRGHFEHRPAAAYNRQITRMSKDPDTGELTGKCGKIPDMVCILMG